jgi:hypothetical protein
MLSILICSVSGAFMQKSSSTYRPIQSLESKQLLHELLQTPEKYRQHLERYATSVIVTITYGRRVHDIYEDEVVCSNRQSQDYLTSVKFVLCLTGALPSNRMLSLCGSFSAQYPWEIPRRILSHSHVSPQHPHSVANGSS